MIRSFICLTLMTTPVWADSPVIERIQGQKTGTSWRFDVTLNHPDTGWDHYADGWRIVDTEGKELGMRVLHHPHVNEQPFTRSLSDVSIPSDVSEVVIQSRDTDTGWSDDTVTISLNDPNYAR